jgi:hypothetical protein
LIGDKRDVWALSVRRGAVHAGRARKEWGVTGADQGMDSKMSLMSMREEKSGRHRPRIEGEHYAWKYWHNGEFFA